MLKDPIRSSYLFFLLLFLLSLSFTVFCFVSVFLSLSASNSLSLHLFHSFDLSVCFSISFSACLSLSLSCLFLPFSLSRHHCLSVSLCFSFSLFLYISFILLMGVCVCLSQLPGVWRGSVLIDFLLLVTLTGKFCWEQLRATNLSNQYCSQLSRCARAHTHTLFPLLESPLVMFNPVYCGRRV